MVVYCYGYSSPVKSHPNLKKLQKTLLTVREDTSSKKQASVPEESPECKRDNIVSVVTETKQKNEPSEEEGSQDESSEEESSTQSESPVVQVKIRNPFDTKLEYLLTNYFLVFGPNHEICRTFID